MENYNKYDYALSQMGQTSELEIKDFLTLEKEGWFFAQYSNTDFISDGKRYIGYKKGASPSLQFNLLRIRTADCEIWATTNYHCDQIVAFKTQIERDEFVATHHKHY